ncbi:hypothetical protein BGX26_001685 [Mortierella sp. AD094]|nr:hypothetical protein BGX26_001685 [Mortierella sp. AD094]
MFQQPPAIKVLSVPELLGLIHPFLSTSEIVQCSKVSKAFCEIFTPMLWRTVSLRTEAQHRHFTENPEVHAALARNGKYIRAIHIQTCKSLAPFLKIDADYFKNVTTLHFTCSIESEVEQLSRSLKVSSRIYTAQKFEESETENMLSLKVGNWLQERDVFLMYHEFAKRILRFDQSRRSYKKIRPEMLPQYTMQAQQQIDTSHRFLDELGTLLHLELDKKDISNPPIWKESMLNAAQAIFEEINTSIVHLTIAVASPQPYRPVTSNRKYLQLLQNLVKVRSTLFVQSSRLVQKNSNSIPSLPTNQLLQEFTTSPFQLQLEQHQQQQQLVQQLPQPPQQPQQPQQLQLQPITAQTTSQQLQTQLFRRAQLEEMIEQQQLMRHHQLLTEMQQAPQRLNMPVVVTSAGSFSTDGQEPITWSYDQGEDQKLLQRFLSHVPGIKNFSGAGFLVSHDKVTDALTEKLKRLGLESLSLVYYDPMRVVSVERLWRMGILLDNCPPQLETLRISGMIDFSPPAAQPPNSESGSVGYIHPVLDVSYNPSNTRIKRLLIEGNLVLRIRPLFLNMCPELRSLSLSVASDEALTIVARSIGEHCHLLEELAVTFVNPDINSNHLADLLEACSSIDPRSPSHEKPASVKRSGLKKLMLCGFRFPHQADLVVDALCRHSSDLTHLSIKSCNERCLANYAQGNTLIHKILKSFKRLEHMEYTLSEQTPAYWVDVSRVKASALINFGIAWPFAATLRVLRIMIDGILRPLVLSPPQSDWLHDSEVALQTQVKVCQILGSLTSLEELALGVDDDDGPLVLTYPRWGYQVSCLELTMEAGLGSMSELKQLRTFKATRMNHRIGLKELEWMCESWPELKEIRGLLGFQEDILCKPDYDKLLKEADVGCEITRWIKEHYPRLRYT